MSGRSSMGVRKTNFIEKRFMVINPYRMYNDKRVRKRDANQRDAVSEIGEYSMKIIYPGSFDPITYGHMDIISRSAVLFDEVIIGVLVNKSKNTLFSVEERIEMIQELLYDYDNVRVVAFEGLLVDLVKREGARGVVRGLRALSDYEYELQIALLNKSLYPEMETVFLVASSQYQHISSSFAKEVVSFHGDATELVPDSVLKRLKKYYDVSK